MFRLGNRTSHLGRMKNSSYYSVYCPGRGSNSRPPAHRSFEHGQGVQALNHSATEAASIVGVIPTATQQQVRAKPWTTAMENSPDIPVATATLGVVNSFCGRLARRRTPKKANVCTSNQGLRDNASLGTNSSAVPELKTWLAVSNGVGSEERACC